LVDGLSTQDRVYPGGISLEVTMSSIQSVDNLAQFIS